MTNILGDDTEQQVLALGRLGWPLRRIEAATGVRRETAKRIPEGGRDPGPPARRRRPPAPKPASEVSTDFGGPSAARADLSGWPPPTSRAPTASACEPGGSSSSRPSPGAAAPWRSGRTWSTTTASPGGSQRPALPRAAARPAAPRGPPGDRTPPGRRGSSITARAHGSGHGKYRRARLFILTFGYSRKSGRLLDLRVQHPALGRTPRRKLPATRRCRPGGSSSTTCVRACSRPTCTTRA